jgi:hypothetical protein
VPDLATAVNAAFAYAHEPTDLPTLLGPPSACFRLPAVRGLLEIAQSVETADELNEILRRVAPTVGVPDPFKAAIMAMVGGTLVEWGADPGELAGLLLARLPAFLAAAESVAGRAGAEGEESLFTANPDGFRAWQALSLMMLPTMAVLGRGAEFRQAARADAELVRGVEALRDHNREADFVATTLGFTDAMELVVLHPGEGKGFRVELEAVNTNFHLFTLLQGELINGGHLSGREVDPEVLAVARGEAAPDRLPSDDARFHFYDWRGPAGPGSSAHADMANWVWGEGRPGDIPEFEGTRVVILTPPVLGSRMWDGNFFANIHDALRSAARMTEVLTAEAFADWSERLRRARG